MFATELSFLVLSIPMFVAKLVDTQSLGSTISTPFYLLARGKPPAGNLTESYITLLRSKSGNPYDSHALGVQPTVQNPLQCNTPDSPVPQFRLMNGLLRYSINATTHDSYTIPLDYSNSALYENHPVSFMPGCDVNRHGLINLQVGTAKFLSAGGSADGTNWMICLDPHDGMWKLGLNTTQERKDEFCYNVFLMATTHGPGH